MTIQFQPPCYVQGRQPPDQAAQSLALNASRDGASTTSLGNLVTNKWQLLHNKK